MSAVGRPRSAGKVWQELHGRCEQPGGDGRAHRQPKTDHFRTAGPGRWRATGRPGPGQRRQFDHGDQEATHHRRP